MQLLMCRQGLRELGQAAQKASSLPGSAPVPDNTVRDMLTKETISMLETSEHGTLQQKKASKIKITFNIYGRGVENIVT